MPNKVVIFPAGKQTEAQAYVTACDTHFAATFEPGGKFGYIRQDAFGQWVAPYYGPPWEFTAGAPFDPPTEVEALRADGVLHDFAVWPPDE